MSKNKVQEEPFQILAPDELIDKTLYLMLQLTEDERMSILPKYAERYGWYV